MKPLKPQGLKCISYQMNGISLSYAGNNFDVVFYGNANTIPYTEDELKQEFKDFEHKKYANAANLNVRIELC